MLKGSGTCEECDLRLANFAELILSGANLSGVYTQHENLTQATLRGANLKNADLSRVKMIGDEFVTFGKGELNNVSFHPGYFCGARFVQNSSSKDQSQFGRFWLLGFNRGGLDRRKPKERGVSERSFLQHNAAWGIDNSDCK